MKKKKKKKFKKNSKKKKKKMNEKEKTFKKELGAKKHACVIPAMTVPAFQKDFFQTFRLRFAFNLFFPDSSSCCTSRVCDLCVVNKLYFLGPSTFPFFLFFFFFFFVFLFWF